MKCFPGSYIACLADQKINPEYFCVYQWINSFDCHFPSSSLCGEGHSGDWNFNCLTTFLISGAAEGYGSLISAGYKDL